MTNSINFTRAQYLNQECTHRQYYAQFVNDSIVRQVENRIGKSNILKSEDRHMNDISLTTWDSVANQIKMYPGLGQSIRDTGDYPTLAGLVCIAKEAAKQIKEQNS